MLAAMEAMAGLLYMAELIARLSAFIQLRNLPDSGTSCVISIGRAPKCFDVSDPTHLAAAYDQGPIYGEGCEAKVNRCKAN